MKTAIQRMEADGIKITPALRYHIDQIQLDAMKEGMRRAAELADNSVRLEPGYSHLTQQNIKQAILASAQQLTEKDLT
jgi:hypothetical protein